MEKMKEIIGWLFFTLVLVMTFISSDGTKAADVRKYTEMFSNKSPVVPSFDSSTPLNVTVQYGGHAYLVCRVQDVGNKSVSWVRKKDGHLLTVDNDTFIADGRFHVLHAPNSDTWTLHLRGTRGPDAGKYECQVSSEPKLSLVYHLNVIVPKIEIRGAPDIYVMAGSGVVLHCIISGLIDFPPFIFWYHNGQRIAGSGLETTNGLPSKDYITPVTVVGSTKSGWNARVNRLDHDSLLAILNLQSATSEFAGNYTCGPPNLQLASATLHVVHNEQPAAMQHGKNGALRISSWSTSLFLALIFTMTGQLLTIRSPAMALTSTARCRYRNSKKVKQYTRLHHCSLLLDTS